MSTTFALNNILQVPYLATNFLSIHKITKPRNYKVTFFIEHCVQNHNRGKTIEQITKKNKLYFIKDNNQLLWSFISTHNTKSIGNTLIG